jgi:hypothetical protein
MHKHVAASAETMRPSAIKRGNTSPPPPAASTRRRRFKKKKLRIASVLYVEYAVRLGRGRDMGNCELHPAGGIHLYRLTSVAVGGGGGGCAPGLPLYFRRHVSSSPYRYQGGYTRNCKLDKLACSIFLYKDAHNRFATTRYSTLEQAPVCTWNMSSSDDDALALAFVLMCKRKPRKKKRDVWCKAGYGKENQFPH